MKIVGIDASSNITGVAIMQDGEYVTHALIDCHKIKDAYERIPIMVNQIWEYLDDVDDIDLIIMEKSILKVNTDTLQKLSNIAGGIMLYAYQNGIKFEHPVPSAWRKKVGLEQSSKVKRQILKLEAIEAVRREYGLDVTDDIAEAILLARSGFDLPKVDIKVEDVEDSYWGE